jgi:hypothetical protein
MKRAVLIVVVLAGAVVGAQQPLTLEQTIDRRTIGERAAPTAPQP